LLDFARTRKRQGSLAERSSAIVERTFVLTDHARERCAERGTRPAQIEFVLKYGRLFHGPDCLVVYFGHREVQQHRARGSWIERLEGLTIVLKPDGRTVCTAFKNRKGLRGAGRKRDVLFAETA